MGFVVDGTILASLIYLSMWVRHEPSLTQPLTKDDIQARGRLYPLRLPGGVEPNSPSAYRHGPGFPGLPGRYNNKNRTKNATMLPFRSCLSPRWRAKGLTDIKDRDRAVCSCTSHQCAKKLNGQGLRAPSCPTPAASRNRRSYAEQKRKFNANSASAGGGGADPSEDEPNCSTEHKPPILRRAGIDSYVVGWACQAAGAGVPAASP